MDALVGAIERELRRDPDHDPERSRKQRRTIAIAVTAFGLVSGARDRAFGRYFGEVLDLRGVLIQGAIALVMLSAATFRFRDTVLRDAHGRRLMLLLPRR